MNATYKTDAVFMIKHLRILVVDDDPSILELLTAFLLEKGCEVEARTSGQEGLEVLRDHPVDLVLSDVAMAEMNGFEFIRIVRANHPGIAIVLMTAFDERYPLSEALRAGADGYITKPFTFKKFSLIFEEAYWKALSRQDWWDRQLARAENG